VKKTASQNDRGCHWQILFGGRESPQVQHDWVHERKDDLLPTYDSKIRWADAESGDDNDLPFLRTSAKSKPRAKLTRREETTGATSSCPPPVAANAKSKPRSEAGRAAGRSRSPAGRGMADSRSRSAPRNRSPPGRQMTRMSFERANLVAFRANELRKIPVEMPSRASTRRPDRIFTANKVEFWMGSIRDVAQDACHAVPTYSLVVDCMGNVPYRPWAKDLFAHTALVECPWNDAERRVGHLVAILNWIVANVLTTSDTHRIIVMCRRGERQSAAVLAVMLILLYDFSLNAAAAQISDRRPTAKLTTERDHGYDPTMAQVQAILSKVKADLVWR
jgi:hypothetical protein